MMQTIHPGSRIAVVAPAGPVAADMYRAGLAILAERYRVVQAHGPDDVAPADFAYLAGQDDLRAEALNRALRNPEIEVIFCARGGYGCMRLLNRLDDQALVRRRVPLVGFSDCTALHAWAASLGVSSIHGPVVTQLPRLPRSDLTHLFALLERRTVPRLVGLEMITPGRAVGALFGGNLSLLCHLCGTPYLPDLSGRILFFEEVSEPPYRIDRMLTHLRLCGLLEQVAGVVVGVLHGCEPQPNANEVLRERLHDLKVPVAMGIPAGHGDRNIALPLGSTAHLDADDGVLWFD